MFQTNKYFDSSRNTKIFEEILEKRLNIEQSESEIMKVVEMYHITSKINIAQ